MTTYYVLVTGSRAHTPAMSRVMIEAGLIEAGAYIRGRTDCTRQAILLVHGAAPGADTIAAATWERWALPTKPFPARWDRCDGPECTPAHRRPYRNGQPGTYCPTAGHRRNQAMVDWVRGRLLDDPHSIGVCFAFYQPGRVHHGGTWDCQKRAAALHVELGDRFVIRERSDLVPSLPAAAMPARPPAPPVPAGEALSLFETPEGTHGPPAGLR